MLNGNRQQGVSAHTAAHWRSIWRRPVMLGVLATTLLLVACGSSEDATSTPSAAGPSGPKVGGTVVMATSHPQSLRQDLILNKFVDINTEIKRPRHRLPEAESLKNH